MSKDKRDDKPARRDYTPPKIVHTENLVSRAVTCAKADDATCAAGPISS